MNKVLIKAKKLIFPFFGYFLAFYSFLGSTASIKTDEGIIQTITSSKKYIPFLIIVSISSLACYQLGKQKGLKTELKSSGLIKVHLPKGFTVPPIEIQNVYNDIFSYAQNEVWLYGSSFHRLNNEEINKIINLLNDGIEFKILIFDPSFLFDSYIESLCPEKRDENPDLFDEKYNRLGQEICDTLAKLTRLTKEYHKKRKTSTDNFLHIRLTSQLVRMRAYIADSDQETGKSFFIPSISKYSNIYCPVYECNHTKDGIAQIYHKGIKNDFEAATPMEEFINKFKNTQGVQRTAIMQKIANTLIVNNL